MDLLFIIIVAIMGAFVVSQTKENNRPARVSKGYQNMNRVHKKSPIVEKSHEFHSSKGETGNDHVDVIGRKHIAHPEPSEGHVVLNGIERKLEDCKWL